MADVNVSKLVKRYGAFEALPLIDLDIANGEFIVFVGPSGSGKSTLLRCIAGLESVAEGTVCIGGKDVTHHDPADRDLSMVFQNYALFPHMTCRANLEFPLKTAGSDKAESQERVERVGRMLRIDQMLDRKPSALSGGQRQRVAIGRAIVKEPKVFLFDEPLSNLDAELRIKMRIEIVKLHRELQNTIIYVTHDQVEAMTMADRIVVLRSGRIEQIGSPYELYHFPANQFVASFIGAPQMNLIPCSFHQGDADRSAVSVGDTIPVDLPLGPVADDGCDGLILGFRPEHASFTKPDVPAIEMEMTVDVIEHLGAVTNIYGTIPMTATETTDITVSTSAHMIHQDGDKVNIWVATQDTHLFQSDGQAVQRHVTPPKWN
ncbi:MAG: ABC transporter ATP-binding protein [Paracoccus sp. (in: a-proteobacteria)]